MFNFFKKKNNTNTIDKSVNELLELQKQKRSLPDIYNLDNEIKKYKSHQDKNEKLQSIIKETFAKGNYADQHFMYVKVAEQYKKLIQEDESYYVQQIRCLEKDIEIFELAISDTKKEHPITHRDDHPFVIPGYSSFRELAIAYERTGEYQKAIDVCIKAKKLGIKEKTSFDNRIKKLENKIKNL